MGRITAPTIKTMSRAVSILQRLALIALLAAGVWLAMLYAMQRSMMYPGTGPDHGFWNAPPPGFETVILETEDELSLKALYRTPKPGRPTILFFHGNGDSAFASAALVEPLLEQGDGALLVNYRGYLGNPGSPSEAGLYADGDAGFAFLEGKGVPRADIIVGGFSLGTGVASHVAAKGGFKGLFLIAPFTSMRDAAAHHFPWAPTGWLVRDHYPTAQRIAAIDAPVLIVHGEDDRMIPASHARALAKRKPDAKLVLLPGVGHNDIGQPAQPVIADWLETL